MRYLVSLDVSSELDAQFLNGIEHQLAVSLDDGQVEDCGRCRDIWQPFADVV